MSLKDKIIKSEYRSLIDNVVQDFYIPLLHESTSYKRAVGFFSSSALVEISKGIADMAKDGGKIEIVASPYLSDDDIQAIKEGYENRQKIIEGALIRQLSDEHEDYYSMERLNLLAHLISDGILDIRIAYTDKDNEIGMYHEKMGILEDKDGNHVAFSGSMNESMTAMSINYETIDVFCDWREAEADRVKLKENAFYSMWNNVEPSLKVLEFPNISDVLIEKYRNKDPNFDIDHEQFKRRILAYGSILQGMSNSSGAQVGARIPADVELHEYQKEAIAAWVGENYRGIFDMATGTGKTYSVIGSYEKSFDSKSNTKIQEYTAKIDKCNARLAEIDAALEELDTQKAAAETRKSEKVIELKQYSEGKKLQKEKEDLQKQIENTTRMRATVYKTMCKDFNASMSPFFSISLIKRALEVLSRHDYSGKDIPFIRDKTIEYLLKQKVCLCGTHLDEGSVPYEKVKSLLDVIPPKSLSTYVTDFKKESKRRAGALQDLVEQMQENLATASQQSDDIMDKTDELHKIEAKLSGKDVSEKVRAINNEIQICVKTINKCNNDRDKLNIERGGLEKERERADTERQNLTLLDEKNRKTQMYLTYARKIYEELENVYRTSEEEIRNRLQDTINDIFKQIYEGGLSLTIDSKYHITVQANDYEGDVETSTAQSISVIFAFITGIIKMARENRNASDDDAKLLSSEPYPLVMDAPLSAFDKRRIKTVCEALPETAEQVIIFIKDTDGELAEDYMGNRIGSRHQFDKKNEFETNLV